jgi:hypothetical protein
MNMTDCNGHRNANTEQDGYGQYEVRPLRPMRLQNH